MILAQAKELAQRGIKMTHRDFTDDEFITMRGNIIVFEDGVHVFFDSWVSGKDYLLDGWEEF